MLYPFSFTKGFVNSPNPLDGWTYLSTSKWSSDFSLITKLANVNALFTNDLLFRCHDQKLYTILLDSRLLPEIGQILLTHYGINYDLDDIISFLNFLESDVQIEMEIEDSVYLQHHETPFDHLPFELLFQDFLFVKSIQADLCHYLTFNTGESISMTA